MPKVSLAVLTAVQEFQKVVIHCSVGVSRFNNSCMHVRWVVYSGDRTWVLARNDSRVVVKVENRTASPCLALVTSRLEYHVTRQDKQMSWACFNVPTHAVLPANFLPCTNRTHQLCAASEYFIAEYAVNADAIQLVIASIQPIPAGSNVRLICVAESYPPASFSWSKIRNKQLPGTGAGWGDDITGQLHYPSGSKLILRDVSEDDEGTYGCRAKNIVAKKVHTVFKTVHLTVRGQKKGLKTTITTETFSPEAQDEHLLEKDSSHESKREGTTDAMIVQIFPLVLVGMFVTIIPVYLLATLKIESERQSLEMNTHPISTPSKDCADE